MRCGTSVSIGKRGRSPLRNSASDSRRLSVRNGSRSVPRPEGPTLLVGTGYLTPKPSCTPSPHPCGVWVRGPDRHQAAESRDVSVAASRRRVENGCLTELFRYSRVCLPPSPGVGGTVVRERVFVDLKELLDYPRGKDCGCEYSDWYRRKDETDDPSSFGLNLELSSLVERKYHNKRHTQTTR